MSVQKIQSPHIDIQAQASFVSAESSPDANYFYFSYRIQIHNRGSSPAQLMSRHWVITDAQGQTEEVKGAGVVGQQPKINPGQKFEYESACPLTTASGSMRGFFQMKGDSGETFDIEIPEFYLVAPCVLH